MSWWNDLVIGCRLALGGGRSSWARLTTTAVGVGLAVAVLLLASSVDGIMRAREARDNARDIPMPYDTTLVATAESRNGTVLAVRRDESFRGQDIDGYVIQRQGPAAPEAPGVERLPGPGEIVVSPALAELLTSPEGELLRPRFPQRVIGTIGPDGLFGPNEHFFYAGARDLSGVPEVVRVDQFRPNNSSRPQQLPLVLLLLIPLGAGALLIPIVIFLATSTRLAAGARDRRLAAVRLLGASARQARRIAAGEALVGALAGVGVGIGFFLLGRVLAQQLSQGVFGNGFFSSDIRPDPGLAVLILVAVPVLAVSVAMVSMRRIIVEPLGVVRNARVAPRRLWWRLPPLVAGVGLLLLPIDADVDSVPLHVTFGIVCCLLSVPAMLPWIVERVVRLLRGGSPASQLAIRRLQLDIGSSARIVGGIATALAGGIALHTLLAPAEAGFVQLNPNGDDIRIVVRTTTLDDIDRLSTTLRALPDVRATAPLGHASLRGPGEQYDELWVASCPVLQTLAKLERCQPGDAFRLSPAGTVPAGNHPMNGKPVRIDGGGVLPTSPQWTVPATLPAVSAHRGAGRLEIHEGVLATPEALRGVPNPPLTLTATARAEAGRPDAVEHLRNAIARFGWSANAFQYSEYSVDTRYAMIRSGLVLGAIVVILLSGLSLLVVAVEQLRERRRPLAALAAVGVPRSVLARSLLWQNIVPVALAALVAVAVGLGLGALALRISDQPTRFDWSTVFTLAGATLIAVLLVTVATLPVLSRASAAEGLRAE